MPEADGNEPDSLAARRTAVFRALGDPTRRRILQRLHSEGDLTQADLTAGADMTRFGVMKHLVALEEAGLVRTRRSGRCKYYTLDPEPLQGVASDFLAALLPNDAVPDFVLRTRLRCTAGRVWDALTEAGHMAKWHISGRSMRGAMTPGSRIEFTGPAGIVMLAYDVIRVEPQTRIVLTVEPRFCQDRTPSRCEIDLAATGGQCVLTFAQYGLGPDQTALPQAWARMAAGLKNWLETGRADDPAGLQPGILAPRTVPGG